METISWGPGYENLRENKRDVTSGRQRIDLKNFKGKVSKTQ